ncbi:hypothetical protein [Lysobacter sp. cf310]|uniref:hypothetical protein n=1 Tax=Lysobacter sp. cf310 TaxID=1761790 RepID=UPI0008E71186|nr:hypothetical protein [Lysobacter sp. cf310]SFK76324.1 hypothetical protein SAMN04487938_1884 [Lysobacter sp. cf310]
MSKKARRRYVRSYFSAFALSMALCLPMAAVEAYAPPSSIPEARQRQRVAVNLFPDQEVAYVDIPASTGHAAERNPADLAGSQSLRDLSRLFRLSREKTVYVAVGSNSDTLAADAIYFALQRDKGRDLSGLHLIHVGDGWERANQLRGRIEPLGAKYYVVKRDPSATEN